MSREPLNMSFCRKVALVKASSVVRTSFLSDLEEVLAKRPIRPGRKELRNRDKPLKVKNKNPQVKPKLKQQQAIDPAKGRLGGAPAKPSTESDKALAPDSSGGEPKIEKKSKIDPTGIFNLQLNEQIDKEEEEEKRKEEMAKNPPSDLPAKQEEIKPDEEDDDGDIFEGESESKGKITALRSIEDPHIFLVNFRNNKEKKEAFFKSVGPILDSPDVNMFFSGKRNDEELKSFYAFAVAAKKTGDFANQLKNIDHETQALPEDFWGQDAPFDSLTFGPDFNKLGVNAAKVKRELNQVVRQLSTTSQGQISALRMMSEIPIDYVRFLNQEFDKREFYIGGNPPNAGTKGTRLVLCDEKESAKFLKVMEYFKPMTPFFNDLYFVNDIDPDFKDYDPFKIVPARALLLEAKTKFILEAKVEVEGGGKVELVDGKTGKPLSPTQFEFLKKFVKEKLFNIANQGVWKKARYYEGDNWIHFNKDHTKAILWGSRTKAISLSKSDILKALPFVKNVNLTFLK